MTARSGHLALLLHAHLRFVRHPEHEYFLEEDWLFEAITETYIPLLAMMERLMEDGVAFRLAMTLTPPLCAMLRDDLLRQRYVRHLERLIALAESEIQRNTQHDQLRELAQFYLDLFTNCRMRFVDQWNGDLLAVFRRLQDDGRLEIVASAATHGFLPLLQDFPEALRAQVLIGRDAYRETFGRDPLGFWLPECAYVPAVDTVLQEANLRWFILDAHGLIFGDPQPRFAIHAPYYTPAGPAAFARDRDSSKQVWSAEEGYPGDLAYRDFYRDIGFDLPLEHLGPISRGTRKFSGVKYHRITGRGDEKQLYDRTAAENAAARHAIHFLEQCHQQIREIGEVGFEPIIAAPFDGELFGHLWFEGPIFLEQFIRHAANEGEFRLTVPSEYLAAHPTQQIVEPAASTWGENGHLAVWLDPSNAWIYPQLNAAALWMCEVAGRYAAAGSNMTDTCDRVLKQLARELLLAQSSDWAFLMKTGTAREYATQRTIDHLARFNRLHDQFVTNNLDEEFLHDCEWRDNIFPNVN